MNNNSLMNYFSFKSQDTKNNQSSKQSITIKNTPKFNSIKKSKTFQKKIQSNHENKQQNNKDQAFKSHNKNQNNQSLMSTYQSEKKQKQNQNILSFNQINFQINDSNFKQQNNFTDKTPEWALPPLVKDLQMRSMNHPDYDPTTLYIPPEAFKKMTPAKLQFWKCKQTNFDKIILFKLGKFYELFYEDANIGVKFLDLNYMGKHQHAGFPEQAVDKFVKKLVDLNFKVAIVEQVETDKELKQRIKRDKPKKHERILKRELISVHSKATYLNLNYIDENFDTNNIWTILVENNLLSLTILNFQINSIFIKVLDSKRKDFMNELKYYISQYKPCEILMLKSNIPQDLFLILKNIKPEVQFNILNKTKSLENNQERIDQVLQSNLQLQNDLNNLIQGFKEEEKKLLFDNLSVIFNHLDKMILLEKALFKCQIKQLQAFQHKQQMILDAQVLDHLNIFENENEEKYSLFWLINKCVTNFGKRKLKNWLANPLYDKRSILQRQEAIEELEINSQLREKFQQILKGIRDIEKLLFYLMKYSIKNKQKVIFFSNVNTKRVKELLDFFFHVKKAKSALEIFESKKDLFQNELLNNLFNRIPDIYTIIDSIQDLIDWKENIPQPYEGCNEEYDECYKKIKIINKELDEYLNKIQDHYKSNEISFVRGKFKIEIQIPESILNKKGRMKEFRYSSRKQKYERFITPFLEKKINERDIAEEKQKELLNIFLCTLFTKFSDYKSKWTQFIDVTATLDVLCSLSQFSYQNYLQLTKPEIEDQNNSLIQAENIKHPVLSFLNSDFVGNDILINEHKKQIILTGPNMGGKSTIMRTTCLNVILAQIGCHVFADKFRWSLIDRIFTRIGASDKLEINKSTFYIEMEETLEIINNATKHSLAIIDELGRGTSTYDGYSIAFATLKYFCKKVNCKLIFSTHYLFEEKDIKGIEEHLAFKQMSYELIQGKENQIVFLYKMINGICQSSFAFNVARIAGLDSDIIKKAENYADHYERNNQKNQLNLQKLYLNLNGKYLLSYLFKKK